MKKNRHLHCHSPHQHPSDLRADQHADRSTFTPSRLRSSMTAARMLENMWGVTSGLTTKIAVAAIALTACVSSAWAQSDEALDFIPHHNPGPAIDIFWDVDETSAVALITAGCVGNCIVAMDIRQWNHADATDLHTAIPFLDQVIVAGEYEGHETYDYYARPPIAGQPFAFDVVVWVQSPESGEVFENVSSVFAIPTDDGKYRTTTWGEFICYTGMARCTQESQGTVFDLNLPLLEDAQ